VLGPRDFAPLGLARADLDCDVVSGSRLWANLRWSGRAGLDVEPRIERKSRRKWFPWSRMRKISKMQSKVTAITRECAMRNGIVWDVGGAVTGAGWARGGGTPRPQTGLSRSPEVDGSAILRRLLFAERCRNAELKDCSGVLRRVSDYDGLSFQQLPNGAAAGRF
jgi:hypothetical protein